MEGDNSNIKKQELYGPSMRLRWNNNLTNRQHVANANGWNSNTAIDSGMFNTSGGTWTQTVMSDWSLAATRNNPSKSYKDWKLLINYYLKEDVSSVAGKEEYVYPRECVWVSGCTKINDFGVINNFDSSQFCVDCENGFRLSVENAEVWAEQDGLLPREMLSQKQISFKSGCIEEEGCRRLSHTTKDKYINNTDGLVNKDSLGNTAGMENSPLFCNYCDGPTKRLTISVGRDDSWVWFDQSNIYQGDTKGIHVGLIDKFFLANPKRELTMFNNNYQSETDGKGMYAHTTVSHDELKDALQNLMFKPFDATDKIIYHLLPTMNTISPDGGSNFLPKTSLWGEMTNPELSSFPKTGSDNLQMNERSFDTLATDVPKCSEAGHCNLVSTNNDLRRGIGTLRLLCMNKVST